MEKSSEMEIDNVVFDNDDIIRWRIEEMYDHSRVNLSFLAGLSGNDDGTQFWDYNKLDFELDYAGEGGEMQLGFFGDEIISLDASLSIEVDTNTSDVVASKGISRGTFVNSRASNAVAGYRSSSLSSPPFSPVPPESPPPRGRGKSINVMENHYGPIKEDHMKRLAIAEKSNGEPYSLLELEENDYDSDVESPLRKRARPATRRRRAINSDDSDVVEIARPKKRPHHIPKKAPKERKGPKGKGHRPQKNKVIAIDDEEEDEDMEDEMVTSDDDESWTPYMKGRKRSKNRKSGQAVGKLRPTSRNRNQVPALLAIGPKKKSIVSKTKRRGEKNLNACQKSFFEQTVENAVRSGRKSKEFGDAGQSAARRAHRRPYYGFPEGQQRLNIPSVDKTDLYLDSTDWDSEVSIDEPPLDSIFVKDSRLGSGRNGWIPSLNKVVAFIPNDKKPKDPLLLIHFRIRHGLFERNLETALNREKECARRWRILEALKDTGFFDNLRIFDVLHPSE